MNRTSAYEKIPINGSISLLIGNVRLKQNEYASCRIQKGLLLTVDESDLSEEGVGFGVPIIRLRYRDIFPGDAQITAVKEGDKTAVTVDYDLNLVEKMTLNGKKINNKFFYMMKDLLSRLHREYPCFREMLTKASNILRFYLNIKTHFEEVVSFGIVRVIYIIHAGNIFISLDTNMIKKYNCTGVMLMNEQGANYFDYYRDSSGLSLKGNAIGTWDEIFADEASFVDASHKIEYTLQNIAAAKLFRGRELVPGRLAWAGLSYYIPPGIANFSYNIRIRCK